ncbi:MAG: hypothetical protein OEN21_13285 [Myxococcales bacterium]|nr:hypothetical protein [Myxococcales bacterium]
MRILSLAALAAALVAALPPTTASGQSDPVVVSGSNIGVMTASQAEARVAELEDAYGKVKMAGPRAGLGISAIVIPGGAFMLGAGLGVRSWEQSFLCPPETPRCRDAGRPGKALAISGAIALVAGVTGLVLSSRKLRQQKMERARIQREIDELERSMTSQ